VYFVLALLYSIFAKKNIYPFFNPEFMGGWIWIVIFAVIMLGILKLISWALIKLNVKTQNKMEEYYKKIIDSEDVSSKENK
jgi:uncharacterized membrane protein